METSHKEIIVYGTFWCPDTHAAAKLLRQLGVKYAAKALENPDISAELRRITGSQKIRRPTIFFPDGAMLIEPNETELREKIENLEKQGLIKREAPE